MNAEFTVQSSTSKRTIMARDFFTGYKQVAMEHSKEVLVSISNKFSCYSLNESTPEVPWNKKDQYVESYKQSKRREDDIAIVTATLSVTFAPGTELSKLTIMFCRWHGV